MLGFLGTVVHFGINGSWSGFSADDVTKLPEIFGIKEMGSAFTRPAVALTTAMTMMFSLFVCERMECGSCTPSTVCSNASCSTGLKRRTRASRRS